MFYLSNKKENGLQFFRVRELYPYYKLQDLSNHPAVIFFPNSETSYSIMEFYIARVPIFVPSMRALIKEGGLINERNCRSSSSSYSSYFTHKNDNYWLQYSDFYQLPFITEFDSWSDLINKLNNVDLNAIREKMEWFNKLREADLLENWCRLLKSPKFHSGNFSHIPTSYNESLKYFEVDRFEV